MKLDCKTKDCNAFLLVRNSKEQLNNLVSNLVVAKLACNFWETGIFISKKVENLKCLFLFAFLRLIYGFGSLYCKYNFYGSSRLPIFYDCIIIGLAFLVKLDWNTKDCNAFLTVENSNSDLVSNKRFGKPWQKFLLIKDLFHFSTMVFISKMSECASCNWWVQSYF